MAEQPLTWADKPFFCCICGERIRLTGPGPIVFYNDNKKKMSLAWHAGCGEPGWHHLDKEEE